MCTHNQYLSKNKKKYETFSSENGHFYSPEILPNIAWACLRNDRFSHHKAHISRDTPLLFAYQESRFSHDAAHISFIIFHQAS